MAPKSWVDKQQAVESEDREKTVAGIVSAIKTGGLDSQTADIIRESIPNAQKLDDKNLAAAVKRMIDRAESLDLRGTMHLLQKASGVQPRRVPEEPVDPSFSADEAARQDAIVIENVAKAIEQGKVPRGQAADMIKEELPGAKDLSPEDLRANIRELVESAQVQDRRGTLYLLGQTARAAGAKGLGD